MTPNPLSIGIVGTGFMGRRHAESWRETPARIAGFVSRAGISALADDYAAPVFATLEMLLPQVDVVDICTPTPLHLAQTRMAAEAGKHVICEKPIALTLADAHEMRAICAANGVRLLIAHVLRFFPEYSAMHAQLAALQPGDLRVLKQYRAGGPPDHANNNWFADLTQSGGPLLDLLIHDYDFSRWVAGDVIAVDARASAGFNAHAFVTLTHRNGVVSQIEGGWHLEPGQFVAHVSAETRSPFVFVPDPSTESAYTVQARHFYDVLAHGAQPIVTADDAIEALRIALAVQASVASGQRVSLD